MPLYLSAVWLFPFALVPCEPPRNAECFSKTDLPAEPKSLGSNSGELVFLGNPLWGTLACLPLIFFSPQIKGLLKGEREEHPFQIALTLVGAEGSF